jgi:hypothetical protein
MKNLSLLLGTTLVLSLSSLVGCGSSVETSGGAGGGSTSSTSTSTGSVGTGGASSTSSTSVGGGAACGGFTGTVCAASEYCDYPRNTCGAGDEQGQCKPIPQACDKIYSPACACDGKVYGNSCEASAAGFDVNDNGGCVPPMGRFACGSSFCEIGVSYCRRTTSDVGDEPNAYLCASLPPVCGNPASCACLAKEICGSMCEASSDGGLVVTCPGG